MQIEEIEVINEFYHCNIIKEDIKYVCTFKRTNNKLFLIDCQKLFANDYEVWQMQRKDRKNDDGAFLTTFEITKKDRKRTIELEHNPTSGKTTVLEDKLHIMLKNNALYEWISYLYSAVHQGIPVITPMTNADLAIDKYFYISKVFGMPDNGYAPDKAYLDYQCPSDNDILEIMSLDALGSQALQEAISKNANAENKLVRNKSKKWFFRR